MSVAVSTALSSSPPGHQRPRILSVPDYVSSTGPEAIEIAHLAGLDLDLWQQLLLIDSLGERPDGQWSAFEVAVVVSRQNGKGGYIEARELAGLFLLEERLIIHSAHLFDTSLEAFRRLLHLIESVPSFDQRVKRVSRAHGEEGIELKGGQRIRFRTRTSGGGRGFTGDCLILDEAMYIPESSHGALMPTLSAVPNPQIIYTGSAVDELIHDHGIVLARLRERGIAGEDPSLMYAEWSVDRDELEQNPDLADDPQMWAQANPALGIRISAEYITNERRSMSDRTFEVERLGAGYWPSTDVNDERLISHQKWSACRDPSSEVLDPVCFAFDITPDRSAGSICAAGERTDGEKHVEVVAHGRGTNWIPDRLAQLREEHDPVAIICDERGPGASLIPKLKDLGINIVSANAQEKDQQSGCVVTVNGRQYAEACEVTFDGFDDETIHHLGTAELTAAVAGATKRPIGDSWAWSRKSSSVDITPLVGVSLAYWGHMTQRAQFDPRDYRIQRL